MSALPSSDTAATASAPRWAWLQAELAEGQAKNQLMVIAAHIPIAVSPIGSEMEWWLGDASSSTRNACTLQELVQVLQTNGNVLMWIAGHRHFNTIKAFTAPDPVAAPHHGFWQQQGRGRNQCADHHLAGYT